MNRFISRFFSFQTKKVRLGRWLSEDPHKTELKILYANEDHCGTCVINDKDQQNDKKDQKKDCDDDDYYRFFLI